MFGLLKNKLASFISGLAGRGEKKTGEAPPEKKPTPVEPPEGQGTPEAVPIQQKAEIKETTIPLKQVEKKEAQRPILQAGRKELPAKAEPLPAKKEEGLAPRAPAEKYHGQEPAALPGKKEELKAAPQLSQKKTGEPKAQPKPFLQEKEAPVRQPAKEVPREQPVIPKTAAHGPDMSRLEKRAVSEKKEMAPRIGIGAAIKSFFTNEITIGEPEVADLIEELELSLLEADVEYGVSMEVASQLRTRLVGMKVPKGEVGKRTREAIAQVLESIMDSERRFDFLKRVQEAPKPVKILFVGPNGAGKTTTMAKIAHLLMQAGITSVFSASDTFRAAAIEQTEVHAERLGIKVIKSKYGADPASVAFDAVNFARSHGLGAVLIDSAGRQDTNSNLLSELKKISRIAKPDIKLYVGESIGGNALIDQIRAFHEAIGIDGAILTKLDCDAKGGTAISISKATGIPILFLGTGQGYGDLVPFDAHMIAQEIMA